MVTPANHPTDDDRRTEYKASQQSAEHHDNLVWQVSSIMWAANSLLIGFSLQGIHDKMPRLLISVMAILGIAMIICVWIFALQFNDLKRQKYERCKNLERILGMTQHTDTKWPAGFQLILYGLLMTLFIAVWIVILCTMYCHCSWNYAALSNPCCR